ncbi:MAG: APC family permease [Dehalococcoidales bacterium]|nr:APC family permease [Dehalococcoidales bacterium]
MEKQKIGLWEAVSIAVGTMIGASIFSVFGVGAQIAGKNLPEAFILSGLLALIVAYSYAKLGGKIISNAGPIAFILKGIGDNPVTGALSILMWLSYVVSISLFAKGFTGYFLPLAHISETALSAGITQVILIAIFTALNSFGSKAVGKAEFYIVILKLAILGVFIVLGLSKINPDYITPTVSSSGVQGTLSAAVIFFLSYMGFGLVTNASEDIKDAPKNVPRAIFISIAIVMVVYVTVSLAAIGNLSLPDLIKAEENALAVAAEPFLGNFGFTLISIGALFSITSALNATLYGGANIAYALAKDRELPQFFERKAWHHSTEGLYITAGLGLVFALTFNIGAIASIISAIFTIIYIFVLISHYRLVKEVGGNKTLLIVNMVILCAVFGGLILYQWQTQRNAFWGMLITLGAVLAIEYIYRYIKKRKERRL